MDTGPALVSILRQGPYLIASIHTALDDSQLVRFQRDLIDRIGEHRSRGVIIDVAALDVLDSFGSRTLRNIAEMARLRGAVTVIVGIQPDVAFAMVLLGMDTGTVHTALDLEEGLAYLARSAGSGPRPGPPRPVNTTDALRRDYRVAFLRYLSSRDEVPLTIAYELGRRAVADRSQHPRALEDPPRHVPAGRSGDAVPPSWTGWSRRRRSSSSRCWRPTT